MHASLGPGAHARTAMPSQSPSAQGPRLRHAPTPSAIHRLRLSPEKPRTRALASCSGGRACATVTSHAIAMAQLRARWNPASRIPLMLTSSAPAPAQAVARRPEQAGVHPASHSTPCTRHTCSVAPSLFLHLTPHSSARPHVFRVQTAVRMPAAGCAAPWGGLRARPTTFAALPLLPCSACLAQSSVI